MKGFIASLALIACFAFLINNIIISNDVTNGMNAVKNTITLEQRTSERQYTMQHEFENAVKKAKILLSNERSNIDNSIILCSQILLISNYSVSEGCVDGHYNIDTAATSEIVLKDSVRDLVSENYAGLFEAVEPCVKFIRYEKENDTIIIGLNTQLDYKNSVVNCDAGFILASNVSNHAVKNVVPAETSL